ncbi:Protein of unknown function DUF262 [Seminavis robusta]|uniref:HNH Cas9-type domain-containing protein n=1 Tax=Seminavis robusta TaxID=568900 RepID=A0A9N8DHZ0_9STRA|nr:Protein of unknown function DUF262 [Seminavis robusta]|eukprot:Sro99_g050960.1 Protein of unknown function DUF262 (439) ;mRNA; r:76972-78288
MWLGKGKLNLTPDYQRKHVWEPSRSSRLVVTVLCRRIVPAVTVWQDKKGRLDVIDGKQRLASLLGFFLAGDNPEHHKKLTDTGKLPTDFTTLSQLDEKYDTLNGLTFEALSEERQIAFSSFTIPVTTIPNRAPQNHVHSCFLDINSGGLDLTYQQGRRVAYWSPYIRLLDKLAKNEDFQRIRDPEAFDKGGYVPCDKESDCELILRAFAWERFGKNYKKPMVDFINRELEHFGNLNNEAAQKAILTSRMAEFELVMKIWANVFSENNGAFRAWKNGRWAKDITLPLWDLMYAVLVELTRKYPKAHMYTKCKKELQAATKSLFTKYDIARELSYRSAKKFLKQKALVDGVLSEVLSKANPENGPRRFAGDLDLRRQQLYDKQEGNCNICNQTLDVKRIHDGSYAHLDHKIPYSKGGPTEEDNAALVHTECNLHKGAKTE